MLSLYPELLLLRVPFSNLVDCTIIGALLVLPSATDDTFSTSWPKIQNNLFDSTCFLKITIGRAQSKVSEVVRKKSQSIELPCKRAFKERWSACERSEKVGTGLRSIERMSRPELEEVKLQGSQFSTRDINRIEVLYSGVGEAWFPGLKLVYSHIPSGVWSL